MKEFLVLLSFIVIILPVPIHAVILPEQSSYIFDIGPATSPLAPGAYRVSENEPFTGERGYGWVGQVQAPVRDDMYGEEPLWGDGFLVLYNLRRWNKPVMALKVNLPPGRYSVEVCAGSGFTERKYLEIFCNNQLVADEPEGIFDYRTRARAVLSRFIWESRGEPLTIWANCHPLRIMDTERSSLNSVAFYRMWDEYFTRDGEGLKPRDDWKPDNAFRRGEAAWREGDLNKSREAFQRVEHPAGLAANAELFLWIAGSLDNRHPAADIREAMALLDAAYKKNPDERLISRRHLTENFLDALQRYEARLFPDAAIPMEWRREKAFNGFHLAAGDLNDPLACQALFYLANMAWNNYMENQRSPWLHYSNQCLKTILSNYPDCEPARMMLGERIVAETIQAPSPANAPAWAVEQRRVKCALRDIVYFWTGIQNATGEMGGGLDDDVEMMGAWMPLILAADDPVVREAYRKMADGVWNSDLMDRERGYQKLAQDSEHSAELMADTGPNLLWMYYGEEDYINRCAATLTAFRDLWTGRDPRGFLRYKSAMLGAREIETTVWGADVPYNIRASMPVLTLAIQEQNEEARKLALDYARSWLDAIRSEACGKPAWIIPAAIRFDTGEPCNPSGDWQKLGQGGHDYLLGCGTPYPASLMLAGWVLSGSDAFLEPFKQWSGLYREVVLKHDPDQAVVGSRAWAVASTITPELLAPCRLVTGATWADDLLKEHGSPAVRWRITGDDGALAAGYRETADDLLTNVPLKTWLLYYTDRVFVDYDDLYITTCGGTGAGRNLPFLAVTWENTGYDVSMLVREQTDRILSVDVYNFMPEARDIGMRAFQLRPGNYILQLDREGHIEPQELRVKARGERIALHLEPRALLQIRIRPSEDSG